MSNVSHQVECIEGDIVHLIETFDLTDASGPGILMRFGRIVDTKTEGIVSASRRISMSVEQAKELGFVSD